MFFLGVVCAMEAALDFLKLGNLEEKTVAIQGVGNVGKLMIVFLIHPAFTTAERNVTFMIVI